MRSVSDLKEKAEPLDLKKVREDFPIFRQPMNESPLVFLDSAASAQKPQQVIDSIREVYENEYANVHRGLYQLSELLTQRYEVFRLKPFLY